MSFLLFILHMILSLVMVLLNGFTQNWYVLLMRYVLLLSYIIPISLRVNLDIAKVWYSWNISTDSCIPGTIARNTTIPEELGRVQMLFSDKTGTLTQNEMKFKSLFIGDTRYDKSNSIDIIKDNIEFHYKGISRNSNGNRTSLGRSSELQKKQMLVCYILEYRNLYGQLHYVIMLLLFHQRKLNYHWNIKPQVQMKLP